MRTSFHFFHILIFWWRKEFVRFSLCMSVCEKWYLKENTMAYYLNFSFMKLEKLIWIFIRSRIRYLWLFKSIISGWLFKFAIWIFIKYWLDPWSFSMKLISLIRAYGRLIIVFLIFKKVASNKSINHIRQSIHFVLFLPFFSSFLPLIFDLQLTFSDFIRFSIVLDQSSRLIWAG